MARPKKPIDVQQLENLAEKQWSVAEISAFMRVNRSTIERRYAENYAAAKQRGRAKLKDLQWKRALEGSDRMLIHMSKHYLNQHEKVSTELSGPNGTPLNIENSANKEQFEKVITEIDALLKDRL